LAYFVSAAEKKTEMTVGVNECKIVEDWEKPQQMIPGNDYRKKVTVKNTGTTDSYIRVFAEMEEPSGIEADYDTVNWEKDGYYWYYRTAVAPGQETEPLLTTVSVSEDCSENITDFNMIVYAESIQSEGYSNYTVAFKNQREGDGYHK